MSPAALARVTVSEVPPRVWDSSFTPLVVPLILPVAVTAPVPLVLKVTSEVPAVRLPENTVPVPSMRKVPTRSVPRPVLAMTGLVRVWLAVAK